MTTRVDDLIDLSIWEARDLQARREISAVDLVEATLAQIEATEPLVHAYTHVSAREARDSARAADRELLRKGGLGLLHGIPVAVKDVCFTRDAPTSGGSRVLEGALPAVDAVVVQKLRRAGAVLVGKTVAHEIAYSQNVVATRSPWNLEYYPGGSSAGSGAAVAARSCFGAIGTDTGGSIRMPASVNGVVGLKPTTGRVSRQGVLPLAPSLDTVGPIARTARDCALMLAAVAGGAQDDPTCLRHPVGDYCGTLTEDLEGVRLGVENSYFFYDQVTPDVRSALTCAIEVLQGLGATVVELDIPELGSLSTVGMVLIAAEASAFHGDWLRQRGHDYAPETRVMLQLGEMVLATDYINAQRARRRLTDAVRAAFAAGRLDALVTPTIPCGPLPMADFSVDLVGGDGGQSALERYVHHTFPPNLTGQPALTVPCGFSADAMPVGMQLIGRPFDESSLLRIGHAYQVASSGLRPPVPPLTRAPDHAPPLHPVSSSARRESG
jgi:aspartyl-tRNA(Asn)/glutamyl-tRNA(Gln) amidotransferase subunit A